jgi:hypothetical protein
MPRKKHKHRRQRRLRATPPKFAPGAAVRAKPGIKDPDYPDIPLGGWAGTITDIDRSSRPVAYLIEWNQATLDAMHPVFRQRCLRDDVNFQEFWLDEDNIEEDSGPPLPVEQPAQIVAPPLDLNDADDRIRAVFGLTSDDPLPPISADTLRIYHRHLAERIEFPFAARAFDLDDVDGVDDVDVHSLLRLVSVKSLLEPDAGDVDEGLLCEAFEKEERIVVPLSNIEVIHRNRNRELVRDYGYWFQNSGRDSDDGHWIERNKSPRRPRSAKALIKSSIFMAVVGGVYGAAVGMIGSSLEEAFLAGKIGAGVLGALAALVGLALARAPVSDWRRACEFGFTGLSLGAAAGGLFGMMLVALAGTIAGAIGGVALARLLTRRGRPSAVVIPAVPGAVLGAVLQAWWYSPEDALAGAGTGAMIGAAAGVGWYCCWVTLPGLLALFRRK